MHVYLNLKILESAWEKQESKLSIACFLSYYFNLFNVPQEIIP